MIVDFDEVEYSNLTRSVLFSQEDALRNVPKVEAAAARIQAMNPNVDVVPIRGDIGWQVGLGLIRRMDVVVGCLDNRRARYWLNRLCMRAGIPWVDGGMEALEGWRKFLHPERTATHVRWNLMPGKNCREACRAHRLSGGTNRQKEYRRLNSSCSQESHKPCCCLVAKLCLTL